jgi:hypothetical protein
MLSSPISAMASSAFEEGKRFGSGQNNQLMEGARSGSFTSNVPTPSGQDPSSELKGMWPGSGKDSISSINRLTQSGSASLSNCDPSEPSCKASQFINNRMSSPAGQMQNQYRNNAIQMRSMAQQMDPSTVLGLDSMNMTGGGDVCHDRNINLPDSFVEKQCVDATLKNITYFGRLPVTNTQGYTQPYCIEGDPYNLSADQSFCEYTWYSCPIGDTLNGAACTNEVIKDTHPGSVGNVRAGHWEASPIRDNNAPVQGTYTVPEDGRWVVWTGTNCLVSRQLSGGGWTYPPDRQTCSCCDRWNAGAITTLNLSEGDVISWRNYTESSSDWDGWVFTSYKIRISVNGNVVYDGNRRHDRTHSNVVSIYQTDKVFCDSGFQRAPGTTTCETPCPSTHVDVGGGVCEMVYPATAHHETSSIGCLGNPNPVYQNFLDPNDPTQASPQMVESEVYQARNDGLMMCATDYYSCPAGMNMNGSVCEDVNRIQMVEDTRCVNLGWDRNNSSEGFLCTVDKITECSSMESDCRLVSEQCIYHDEAEGSPTFGQCLATEKTYECPEPGGVIRDTVCNYQPFCLDGNCFDDEPVCDDVPPEMTASMKSTEVCEVLVKEEIHYCPNNFIYSDPKESPFGHTFVIGAETAPNCPYVEQSGCVKKPIELETDEHGDSYWPSQSVFSCIANEPPVNMCASLELDQSCQMVSENVRRYQFGAESGNTSGILPGAQPIITEKTFTCDRTGLIPQNTCGEDFAMVGAALELARQGGTYMMEDPLKVFSGEFNRCDRRTAGFGGAGIGSKNCCNISAPDPQSNHDIMSDMKQQVGMSAATSMLSYVTDTGSKYVYDFMMKSDTFSNIAGAQSASSIGSGGLSASGIGVSYAGVGLSYGASTAAGTASYSIAGSSVHLTFNPYAFAITAAIMLYDAYQQAIACDEQDYQTATLKKGGLCYSYGSWCDKKQSGIFGSTCIRYRTGHCCYNSKIARIINQQARPQLNLSMSDCGGLTPDQLNMIDWSRIDLSEFVAEILKNSAGNIPTASTIDQLNQRMQQNITGSAGTSGVQPIDVPLTTEPGETVRRPHH